MLRPAKRLVAGCPNGIPIAMAKGALLVSMCSSPKEARLARCRANSSGRDGEMGSTARGVLMLVGGLAATARR